MRLAVVLLALSVDGVLRVAPAAPVLHIGLECLRMDLKGIMLRNNGDGRW